MGFLDNTGVARLWQHILVKVNERLTVDPSVAEEGTANLINADSLGGVLAKDYALKEELNEAIIPVDQTLTQEGLAAESKATGTRIAATENRITTVENNKVESINGLTGKNITLDVGTMGAVLKTGDTMTGALITPATYAKGDYPSHGYMNADGTPVVLMQVDASNHRLGIHQKRGGASVWDSNEAYFLPAPNLDQTATVSYDILTSKSPVTIAQGGTGATTRAAASRNIFEIGQNPITSTDDTTSKWGSIGQGTAFYTTANVITDQPAQYGILANLGFGSEVFQLWHTQPGGEIYYRSGNGSGGWSGTWKKLLDSSNFTSTVTPAAIGAAHCALNTAVGSHTQPVYVDSTGELKACSSLSLPLYPDRIEFSTSTTANHGGYLDFHFNGNTGDFTSRIIEDESGILNLNYGYGVKLGSIYTAPVLVNDDVNSIVFSTVTNTQQYALIQSLPQTNQLRFVQKNSGGSIWANNEHFSLPAPDLSRTGQYGYEILTTKSAVTVAQGGTGATDASNARKNLLITSLKTTDAATTALVQGVQVSILDATAAGTGDPTGGTLLTAANSNNRGMQIANGYSANSLKWRFIHSDQTSDAGTAGYSPWYTIYHSGNIDTLVTEITNRLSNASGVSF